MATEASKFKIGVFLIGGFLAVTAGLIWVGASRVFEKTRTYTTYFAESVQGLDVGSPVKYRGVPLGRVTSFRVVADGRLVEVKMDIDPSFRVPPKARARLAITGLTGAAFIDIGVPEEGSAVSESPELPFEPPPDFIPSQPSLLTNLLTALAEVATTIQGADLPKLAEEVRGLAADTRRFLASGDLDETLSRIASAASAVDEGARHVATLAGDARISALLDRASSASAHLDDLAGRLNRVAARPELEEIVRDVGVAAAQMRRTAEDLRAGAEQVRVGARLDELQSRVTEVVEDAGTAVKRVGKDVEETSAGAREAIARLDRVFRDLEVALPQALNRISRAADRIESLAASLEASPSRLLLEEPPAEDFR